MQGEDEAVDVEQLSEDPLPDLITGCLLGGAIGDALGEPLEALSRDRIADMGGAWPDATALDMGARRLDVSDETQLCLLTARAILQASVRARAKGIGGALTGIVQAAYLTWLHHVEGGPAPDIRIGLGLLQDAALSRRTPSGKSTMAALRKAAARKRPGAPLGTLAERINGSPGNGALVRSAPFGLIWKRGAAFDAAVECAALTHGSPDARLPAGAFAAAVWTLLRGGSLPGALRGAREELLRHPGHEPTAAALDAAVSAAAEGPPSAGAVERFGPGRTGPEALAIAVYAALAAERAPDRRRHSHSPVASTALELAVDHRGDSDATGALCGQLIGARYGTPALPGRLQSELPARRAILLLAADLALEFGPDAPTGAWGAPPMSWHAAYPDA
ncbi:hypothetical protein GCM10027440_00850 [Nocardiopsis coralliicola]